MLFNEGGCSATAIGIGMRCFASKYNRTGCNLYANAEGCVVLIGLPGVVSMKARP